MMRRAGAWALMALASMSAAMDTRCHVQSSVGIATWTRECTVRLHTDCCVHRDAFRPHPASSGLRVRRSSTYSNLTFSIVTSSSLVYELIGIAPSSRVSCRQLQLAERVVKQDQDQPEDQDQQQDLELQVAVTFLPEADEPWDYQLSYATKAALGKSLGRDFRNTDTCKKLMDAVPILDVRDTEASLHVYNPAGATLPRSACVTVYSGGHSISCSLRPNVLSFATLEFANLSEGVLNLTSIVHPLDRSKKEDNMESTEYYCARVDVGSCGVASRTVKLVRGGLLPAVQLGSLGELSTAVLVLWIPVGVAGVLTFLLFLWWLCRRTRQSSDSAEESLTLISGEGRKTLLLYWLESGNGARLLPVVGALKKLLVYTGLQVYDICEEHRRCNRIKLVNLTADPQAVFVFLSSPEARAACEIQNHAGLDDWQTDFLIFVDSANTYEQRVVRILSIEAADTGGLPAVDQELEPYMLSDRNGIVQLVKDLPGIDESKLIQKSFNSLKRRLHQLIKQYERSRKQDSCAVL